MSDYQGSFMKFAVAALVLVLQFSATSFAFQKGSDFPEGPDTGLTPGSLCSHPSEHRYPERIPYCQRNVESQLKREIFREYDSKLGYNTRAMDRQDFKIDHYIPLCMGGSNERDNLWPQHVSVYTLTDPMEGLACEKMAEGKLDQAHAIELIKLGKNDFSKIDGVIEELNGL
ncbi:MAG: HNH endonuclease signature motif containing protein [Bdellovibrionota bacterium]|mgnify:CR=1 FL=1